MKKLILSIALLIAIAGTAPTLFGQDANNQLIKAREGFQKAQKDTVLTKLQPMNTMNDSVSTFQAFKKSSEQKIARNEEQIIALKEKYLENDQQDTVSVENIALLEQKNNDLKKSLAKYKEAGEYEWSSFKNMFTYDMAELEKALKEIAPAK